MARKRSVLAGAGETSTAGPTIEEFWNAKLRRRVGVNGWEQFSSASTSASASEETENQKNSADGKYFYNIECTVVNKEWKPILMLDKMNEGDTASLPTDEQRASYNNILYFTYNENGVTLWSLAVPTCEFMVAIIGANGPTKVSDEPVVEEKPESENSDTSGGEESLPNEEETSL